MHWVYWYSPFILRHTRAVPKQTRSVALSKVEWQLGANYPSLVIWLFHTPLRKPRIQFKRGSGSLTALLCTPSKPQGLCPSISHLQSGCYPYPTFAGKYFEEQGVPNPYPLCSFQKRNMGLVTKTTEEWRADGRRWGFTDSWCWDLSTTYKSHSCQIVYASLLSPTAFWLCQDIWGTFLLSSVGLLY